MQNLNLPLDATVTNLIEEGNWNVTVHDIQIAQLKERILAIQIDSLLDKDNIVWKPNPEGTFTNKSAYRANRNHNSNGTTSFGEDEIYQNTVS